MRSSHAAMGVLAGCLAVGAGTLRADWPQWRGPDRSGRATDFAVPQSWPKQLKQRWKVPVRIHGSLAAIAFRYAVAPAIEAAIKKTGKADRKAIRDALEEIDVPNTPVGRVKFDDTHQAFINMLLVQIDGGQLKVLEKIPIQP